MGGLSLLAMRSFCRVQESDQIGHLGAVEPRPGDSFGPHLIEHSGAVMPQRRDHRHAGEGAAGEPGSSGRRVVVATRAMFGRKDATPGRGIARGLKELFRPQIAQEFAHGTRFAFCRLRSRGGHRWGVIPHRSRDFGEGLALDAAR